MLGSKRAYSRFAVMAFYILRAFHRRADGSWTAIATANFDGPTGRMSVERGAVFKPGQADDGLDLASWLDQLSEMKHLARIRIAGQSR